MSTSTNAPHVVAGDSGTATISDPHHKIEVLAAEHYHYGWTAEELLHQHPDLCSEQVYAALAYFYDHYDEIVPAIATNSSYADAARHRPTLTRAEQLSLQHR